MKDVFGTDRGCCAQQGCACADFCSLRDAMTGEQRQAEGTFVACQRASELFLTCRCGHAAHEHTPRSKMATPVAAALAPAVELSTAATAPSSSATAR